MSNTSIGSGVHRTILVLNKDLGIPEALPRPSAELISCAERQIRNTRQFKGGERRSDKRKLMVVPVVMQPVDDDLQPVGQPFSAVTRDISAFGVGLICVEPIARKRFNLCMQLADEEVNLMTELYGAMLLVLSVTSAAGSWPSWTDCRAENVL